MEPEIVEQSSEDTNTINFVSPLLDAAVREGDEPDPDEDDVEPEVPPAAPQGESWKEFRFPEKEDIHGFLKGRKADDVVKSYEATERRMQESNRRANVAEQQAAALATANEVLIEQLKRVAPQPEPQPPAREEEDLNEFDILADPVGAFKRQESRYQQMLREALEERDRQAEQRAEAEAVWLQATQAAREAFSQRGIPEDQWQDAFGLLLPELTRTDGKYYQRQGPLNVDNYLDLMSNIDRMYGREAISGSTPSPAAAPAPAPAGAATKRPPTPPGTVSRPGANDPLVPEKGVLTVGAEERRLYEHMGMTLGKEGEELEAFVQRSAQKWRQQRQQERQKGGR